jgi:hypothetical protein
MLRGELGRFIGVGDALCGIAVGSFGSGCIRWYRLGHRHRARLGQGRTENRWACNRTYAGQSDPGQHLAPGQSRRIAISA